MTLKDLTQNPFTMPEKGEDLGHQYTTCNGPVDCIPLADSAGQPQCFRVSRSLQRLLSFDAVYPALGLCLTMGQIFSMRHATATKTGMESFGDLFRRDVQLEREGLKLECYCNATCIAESCCY